MTHVRRIVVGAFPALVIAAALGIWWATKSEPHRVARPRVGQIAAKELHRYPPILFIAGDPARVHTNGSGDLYVADLDATHPRRIKAWSPSLGHDGSVYGTYDARWSPDGRRIGLLLSVWYGDPYGRVAVISSDGKDVRSLRPRNDTNAIGSGVRWSPDGRLLFADDAALAIVSADVRTVKHIWHGNSGNAEWSPDGRRIVAVSARGIVTLRSDGKNVTPITHSDADADPQWSPDGRSIAFIRHPRCYGKFECLSPSNVFVVAVNGRQVRQLTRRAYADSVLWSPDSRTILLTESTSDDIPYIAIAKADGSNLHPLAKNASAVAWSLDGKKILFWRATSSTESSQLWIMDANGGRQTRLPFNPPAMDVIAADWRR